MRNTFLSTLTELAAENPKIWLLCGDLGFSVLESFAARFPDRYLNVGVAEQNMAGIAAGIALSGNTVFIYSIGNFPTLRCLEQLRNDVCYHGADVKVVSVGGGFAYGSQGYTHHAIEDVAVMSALPGMEVFVPCDPAETRDATRHVSASGKPSYLRLSRSGEPVLSPDDAGPITTPRYLRNGGEVCILASGPVAGACLETARLLDESGIRASVISVPCLKPLDKLFISTIARSARLIVSVEEHVLHGGLGSGLASQLAAGRDHPPLLSLGIPEPAGKISVAADRESLMARAELSPSHLAERIRKAARSLADS